MFAGVGLVMIASQVVLIELTRGLTHDTAPHFRAVWPLILGLAIPTGVLLIAAPSLARVPPTRLVMAALIVTGLLLRFVWFGTAPPLEDDFNRYMWDGAVVARGLDPYAHAPQLFIEGKAVPEAYRLVAGPAAAMPVLLGINFPDMRTIYPSVAQVAFALAHQIAPFKVDGLRVVFLAGELATLWLLFAMLRRLGMSSCWAVLYWWNPFVATMLVGLVHVDALIPPFVLGAVMAMSRGRALLAVALIGLGAGVKVWPVILAPMALWPLIREPRRLLLACSVLGSVLAIAVGPVVISSLQPGSGLSAYATGWSNNNAFYAWAYYVVSTIDGTPDAPSRILRPLLAVATAGVAIAMALRGEPTLRSIVSRALVVAATVFYLSPAQFPWYAVWFLPLAVLAGNRPLMLASVLLPAYYLFFPLWPIRFGVWFFYGTAFIHAVPVLTWVMWEWHARRHRPAAS